MKLYYDVYDPAVGDFTSMSEETKTNVYEKDVEIFYKAFTKKEIPLDENGKKLITRFDQIPLEEYHKSENCQPNGYYYARNYEGLLKDTLFKNYAEHVNTMMNKMNSNQDKLLTILEKLFTFKPLTTAGAGAVAGSGAGAEKDKEELSINPNLDENSLRDLVNTTRQLIVDFIVTCESDFLEGIALFEGIVAVQLAATTKSQIKAIDNISLAYMENH